MRHLDLRERPLPLSKVPLRFIECWVSQSRSQKVHIHNLKSGPLSPLRERGPDLTFAPQPRDRGRHFYTEISTTNLAAWCARQRSLLQNPLDCCGEVTCALMKKAGKQKRR